MHLWLHNYWWQDRIYLRKNLDRDGDLMDEIIKDFVLMKEKATDIQNVILNADTSLSTIKKGKGKNYLLKLKRTEYSKEHYYFIGRSDNLEIEVLSEEDYNNYLADDFYMREVFEEVVDDINKIIDAYIDRIEKEIFLRQILLDGA